MLLFRPNRKHLTVIPEEMKPIKHWFNVVLAGARANDFARMAVESEFAECHRPSVTKMVPATESVAASSAIGGGHANDGNQDGLVLFCPTGGRNSELARLRFYTCTSFADALPLTRNRSAAKNLAIVLLFWQGDEPSEEADIATKEAISIFQTRISEISHLPPNCRPHTTVLSLKASASQESYLSEFRARQEQVKVSTISCKDDSEDVLAGSLQTLCENIIIHQRSAAFSTKTRFSVLPSENGEKRCGCCCRCQ